MQAFPEISDRYKAATSRQGLILLLVTGWLVLLLHGCSSGVRPVSPAPESRLDREAAALESRGLYGQAAQLYYQAAAQAVPPKKYGLLLNATDSLIRGADYDQATAILDDIEETQLDEQQRQHYHVSRAEIALARQRPAEALDLLQTTPSSGPYVADYYRLRADAYHLNNQYFRAARERVALDQLLTGDERHENHLAIWDALGNLTDLELQQLRTAPPPDPLSGWMELIELTRLYLQQPEALADVTPHWQMRYPGHPASEAFIGKLLGSMRAASRPPESLALLLPLNGNLAGAAGAIRDGIMSAYYDTPDGRHRPPIRIYDTGDDPAMALYAYQQAVAEGAQFVIGPLRKEAVEIIATRTALPVPVLALNHIEVPSPVSGEVPSTVNGEVPSTVQGALYQFGLAPEDEAREVARRASHDGHSSAIALVPQTERGERIYVAFATEWQNLGGTILETQQYNPAEADHGGPISAALNLDASRARHQQLVRTLGRQLDFEPRRRQDIDFVFLVANPRQARLIHPQLSFYRASRVPVYATSQVYTGQADQARDSDINGIVFCDMPWTLEHGGNWEHLRDSVNEHWPANAARYPRLYALGLDAYRIVPYLGQLDSNMFGIYHGVSGNLSLDSQGQIHRSLRCAQFRNGLPVLLDAAQETADRHPGAALD
jgi:outer membrane PBP1 activator LpoA protein